MLKNLIFLISLTCIVFGSKAFSQERAENRNHIIFEGQFLDEAQGVSCRLDLVLEKTSMAIFKIVLFKITNQNPNSSFRCVEQQIQSERKALRFFEKSPQSSNENIVYYNLGSINYVGDENPQPHEQIDKSTQFFIYKIEGTQQYYLSMNIPLESLDYETRVEYPIAIELNHLK